MKKHIIRNLFVVTLGALILACASSQTIAERNEKAERIRESVENFNFIFDARYAQPLNYRSIYLSPYYNVKVSPDTVEAYLPYFGRAYTAPMDPLEGGIKFTSKKFNYEITEGKKSGNWLIKIQTEDVNRQYTLYFDIWDNGNTRLNVQDQNRQAISFDGNIDERNSR